MKEDDKEDDPFSLTPEQEAELDRLIDGFDMLLETTETPEGWVHLTFAMPESFKEMFLETLAMYAKLTDSDKTFPALEAMVMEARNSLSQYEGTTGVVK